MSLLELPSLEERRVRGDLIKAFKLLKGIAKLDYSLFFKLFGDSKVRGHTYKIVKNSFRLNVRKNFFSNRVVDAWNELPLYVVDAEIVNSLRQDWTNFIIKFKLYNLMPRIFKHLEAGCLQVNLMSTSAQINQLKYTILYYFGSQISNSQVREL